VGLRDGRLQGVEDLLGLGAEFALGGDELVELRVDVGLAEQRELLPASAVTFRQVAAKVRELCVRPSMGSAAGERNHVVQTRAERVGPCKAFVHLPRTESTSPTVTLVDFN
jgi:hypothetical protein